MTSLLHNVLSFSSALHNDHIISMYYQSLHVITWFLPLSLCACKIGKEETSLVCTHTQGELGTRLIEARTWGGGGRWRREGKCRKGKEGREG